MQTGGTEEVYKEQKRQQELENNYNLSGEKNRKRASPQETVILMKQTFEPFPLLSSTGNLKKGSQFSLNYKLPGRLLHRNQTALSDRLSHVSPVRCSVHYRGF